MEVETMLQTDNTNTVDDANATVVSGLEVTFKKNPYQREKYLEGEPKILGITQIMLGLFLIGTQALVNFNGPLWLIHTLTVILCIVVIIAGSLAIAAQNLHLPTMKTCLGMQIVVCSASVLFVCVISILLHPHIRLCRQSEPETNDMFYNMCGAMNDMYRQFVAVEMLMGSALIALSATLAAFCCKVIKCCSPPHNMPVITVNSTQLATSG